jgi:hypothetical protein
MLLKSAGYEVVSLPADADLTKAAAGSAVAVLCHSFLPYQAANLAQKLRECNPAIRVLEITAYDRGRCEIVDAECCMYNGPRTFLETVASLVPSAVPTAISGEPGGGTLRSGSGGDLASAAP